jgi:hypothetical protein
MVECDGADQQGRNRPVGDEVTDDGANAALPSPPALFPKHDEAVPSASALSRQHGTATEHASPKGGFGSPSIQRHPRKSVSVSAPLLPSLTSSPTRRALLLGTSVAIFASRAALGSVSGAGSQQLGRRDDGDIVGR